MLFYLHDYKEVIFNFKYTTSQNLLIPTDGFSHNSAIIIWFVRASEKETLNALEIQSTLFGKVIIDEFTNEVAFNECDGPSTVSLFPVKISMWNEKSRFK